MDPKFDDKNEVYTIYKSIAIQDLPHSNHESNNHSQREMKSWRSTLAQVSVLQYL